jgi:hypothetical protein
MDQISVGQASHISQITQGTPHPGSTMFGGRNEQASYRHPPPPPSHGGRGRSQLSISTLRTTPNVAAASATANKPAPNTQAQNECDTNADTCCLGRNFVVLHYTTRSADVYAYDKSYKPQEGIPIVTGGTGYDDSTTGSIYILVFNEALYYGTKLDHSLINPDQVRSYGIGFWDNPFDHEKGLHGSTSMTNYVFPCKLRGLRYNLLCELRHPTN